MEAPINNIESESGFIAPDRMNADWQDISILCQKQHIIIYKATRLGRHFILKSIQPKEQHLSAYSIRQEREFQLGFALSHPHIVTTYALEQVPSIGKCIVLEYVNGITLTEWMQTKPSRSARQRAANQLIDTLDYLHTMQIVHHDIKGNNILITRNGQNVKLIDFGLSAEDAELRPTPQDVREDILQLGGIMQFLQVYPLIAKKCILGRYLNVAAVKRATRTRDKIKRLLIPILSFLICIASLLTLYFTRQERIIEKENKVHMLASVKDGISQIETQTIRQIDASTTHFQAISNIPTWESIAEIRDSISALVTTDSIQKHEFDAYWLQEWTEAFSRIYKHIENQTNIENLITDKN